MKEFNLVNKNSLKINIIEGKNCEKIKAVIIHLHGMGSHFQPMFDCIDEFYNRDELFSRFSFKSFALEFHGHGKSEGNRCSIFSFDDLLDDLEILINYIENFYKQPIFLMAESMGCAVALKYTIVRKNNIKGLIFSAPLFGIDEHLKPPQFVINVLKIICNFFPEVPLYTSSNSLSKVSTNNKGFLEAKNKSNFSYNGSHRLCTCNELLKVSDWIRENGHLLNIPILIFHGLKDTITEPLMTKKIFEKMHSNDKELLLLDDGYHCLLIESNENPYLPGYIISKIISWINKKID
jgi:alpha-beta hydrolase superfamily lysophospholipase